MHGCALFHFLKKSICTSKQVPLWQQIIGARGIAFKQYHALLATKNNKVHHNITLFVKYNSLCYLHKLVTLDLKYLTIQNTVPKYVPKRQNQQTIQTASFLSPTLCPHVGDLDSEHFHPKDPHLL